MTLHHMLRAAAGNSVAAEDAYFKNVSLLLTGDGTNGAQNNTFVDSSTNNFTITRNGNTTQGTFSPYGNLWSNYFSNSGFYKSTGLLGASVSTLTVEFWIFMTAVPVNDLAGGSVIAFDAEPSGQVNYFNAGVSTNQKAAMYWYDGSPKSVSGSTTIPLNTWAHVAIVVNSNAISMYVNGVAETLTGTTTLTNRSGTSGYMTIGKDGHGYTTGYVSNLRVTTTAVYTSAFTPSTTPLTAVSGTSLLTCQSNRFIDNSSNNFTLTVNGNTSVQRFSPFNPTAPYSAATIGGSGYFDGSGDYLSTSSNTAFALSGAYTVELWFYPTVTYTTSTVNVGLVVENTSGGFALHLQNGSGGGITIGRRGVAVDLVSGAVPVANMWNHIVAVRNSSNSTSIYLNGTRVANATVSSSYVSSGSSLEIGAFLSSNVATGYFCGTRIVKGTAVYDPTQSTITVPTAPLTAITNTSLLLNFTNAGIPDAAMMNDLETVGNAQVSTSVKKYGTGSLAFDGSGDGLFSLTNPNFVYGTGDFTIEMWVYLNSSGTYGLFGHGDGSAANPYLYINTTTPTVFFNNVNVATGPSIATQTWVHIAVTRSGNSLRVFSNGVSGTPVTNTTSLIASGPIVVGCASNLAQVFNGYIDDLRITKGYARYTANFTPPTAALPTY